MPQKTKPGAHTPMVWLLVSWSGGLNWCYFSVLKVPVCDTKMAEKSSFRDKKTNLKIAAGLWQWPPSTDVQNLGEISQQTSQKLQQGVCKDTSVRATCKSNRNLCLSAASAGWIQAVAQHSKCSDCSIHEVKLGGGDTC